jgi:hypothetical protein
MRNTLKVMTVMVALSDGQIKWKTDQQPAFVRGGSILAEGLLLTTDGGTKLYLVEPDPSGVKPLASAVMLEPGDDWAPWHSPTGS